MRWGLWRLSLPFTLAVVGLVGLPLALCVALAGAEYDGLGTLRWVGLAHVERLRDDPLFAAALEASLVLVALAVPLRLALACFLALALQGPGRGVRAARALAFAPTAVPDVAYALVWLWLLNPLYGPLSALLAGAGVADRGFLLTAGGARGALVAMSVFQVGELLVVLLAARRELPPELYEACEVEGASPLFVLRRVTLPLLLPVLALLAARDVAWTLQATFVPALLVTRGGPLYATTTLPLYAFQSGFDFLRFGQAAAVSLAMLALTAVLVAGQIAALRRARTLLG